MYADTRGWVRIRSTRPAASTRRCCSTTSRRPTTAGVGRGDPGRPRHPQPAGLRAVQRRRALARARRSRPTSEILDWVREDAETALHPSCTAKMGVDEMSVVDPATMRVHGTRGAARRRRLGLPLRHQRQHLRPGDDGRREGRRPDRSATPRCPPPTCPYYRHRDGTPLYPPGDSRNHGGPRHDHDHDASPPAHRPRTRSTRSGETAAVHVEDLWKIFGPRADKIMAPPGRPALRARSCRRRPATSSASATSPSTSPPARSSW